MADRVLNEFVHQALAHGVSRQEAAAELATAGWSRGQIEDALAAFAQSEFPVPVPRPRPYLSAREAFLYLILFIALAVSAGNFGLLVFQLINFTFPGPLANEYARQASEAAMRWSISALIVAYPLYIILSWRLNRLRRRNPAMQRSRIRKWLTYLTLVAAAGTLLGDFITVVNSFLSGELTVRFALKAATIAVIAGIIFLYYVADAERDEEEAADAFT